MYTIRIRTFILGVALAMMPSMGFAASLRQPDFNNDGFADLVMPVSGETIGSAHYAGAVNVIYGTVKKLKAAGNQLWNQNVAGIAGSANTDDWFGYTVAWGDFNADGYSDLVVGVPGENHFSGAVHVIYGSALGLTAAGSQFLREGTNGVSGTPASDEYFGWALAVGDFDGDGVDDLAIGIPDQTVGGDDYAGGVHVLYGLAGSGISTVGQQFWTQDSPGLDASSAEYLDEFGTILAAGDFNGDGKDDLAIGVPFENFSAVNCGAVNLLYGSPSGLTATGNLFFSQNTAGIADAEEEDDLFGGSLAAGDFDGDGFDDLAISAEGETVGTRHDAGAVHVIYGSASGLNFNRSQYWTQNSTGIADACESGDWFGSTLATGDFNNDGLLDLVIGVAGESIGTATRAGAVHVLFGSAGTGLTATKSKFISQNSTDVAGVAEKDDMFGSWLMIGDFNGDGMDDLAVGVPYENVSGVVDAGAVQVFYSNPNGRGPDGLRDQLWTQDSKGILDQCEKDDNAGLCVW